MMKFRNLERGDMGRLAVSAGIFCAIVVVCFFVTARSVQSQPGEDSINLTQKEQALVERAINQSIENMRRYYARKEYDKVLEECENLEKLDPGNNIAVYYRSIARLGQAREPFGVDLELPSVGTMGTSPTRTTAFPRVIPPPSGVVSPTPIKIAVAEPTQPLEDQPEVIVQHGEPEERPAVKASTREKIRELIAQPSTRYIVIGVGFLVTFLIIFQIKRSRRKTKLAIEAARASVEARAEEAKTELPTGPPLLEERAEKEAEAPSPVGEELEPAALFTDTLGEIESVEQQEVKAAEPETTEEPISAVPEVGAVDMSEASERERLVSAVEGVPSSAEPVEEEEEDIGAVSLGPGEETASQPSALFSEEDISPAGEKAEVGAPDKKEQIEPESSVPFGEEEDVSEPDGSMKLDEFLFEEAGKQFKPSPRKPDDASVEEWKRKAHDEDFEKMMFTPGAEDSTSVGKRISEDDTLAAPPGKERQPSPRDESLEAPEAKEPEPPPPPQQEAPPAPRPEDQETMGLPERETKILRPSDEESPVKGPARSEQEAKAEASPPDLKDMESTKTSARVSQDKLQISDDLRVTPEEEAIRDSGEGTESQARQPEVFGSLNLDSLEELVADAGDKGAAGAPSKIMEERNEALFRDQHKKACDAFAQKDWSKAIHYFSVALALRPGDKQVKENLRIARENRKKQENKKKD